MAQADTSRKRTIQRHKTIKLQVSIRCIRNLQQSRAVTDNIMKRIEHGKSDIVFIQESYLYQNRTTGIIKSHRNSASHEDKCRAEIIIANNKMDAVLFKPLSKPVSVRLELKYNNTRFFAASMYFDITKEI